MIIKYKPYIGRIFYLKKNKIIPGSEDKFARTRKHYKNFETFGEACLIVDETNTRVQVTTIIEGKMLWIAKFFLAKEIFNVSNKNHDEANQIANKLIEFSIKELQPSKELNNLLKDAAITIKQLISKK